MKVRLFRQRVTQVHEAETEVNTWLEEMDGKIQIHHVQQSSYLTDNSEHGTAAFIISVWYTEN